MLNMRQELLPNFDIPVVVATVTWNGASPEDVDSQITQQVEDAVKQNDSRASNFAAVRAIKSQDDAQTVKRK